MKNLDKKYLTPPINLYPSISSVSFMVKQRRLRKKM